MEQTIEQLLQRGVTAHKEGRLQDAEHLYRTILQSQPVHPDANHNLGVIEVLVNKSEDALPLFRIALEANPKIEQFWLSYIGALIKVKQFDNANRLIEQAKNQGVADDKLNVLKTQLASINKQVTVGTLSPSQQQLNNLSEYYQSGYLIDAERLALSFTQEFPQHQFAWKVLGAVLKQTGRLIDSLNAMQKSLQLAPQDSEAHYNLGITLKELGRLEEAEASYNQAISLKPDYAEAYSNLGIALKELGRLEEAEVSYNQAIDLKPDYAEAYYNLGNTLKDLVRLEEAEASYNQAIALKPDYAEANNNLGITLQDLGRWAEAEAIYNQAISLKPDYAEAYSNLGITLQDLGRWAEAEASYNQAIALKPDYAEAHLNLCELLEKMNREDELLSFIKNISRKIFLKKADFLYYEILIEFRKENYEIAEELIKKININELLDKRQPSAMKLQGDIYHHKKNYSSAFEAYKAKNKHVKDSHEYKKQEPEKYFNQQREKVAQIKQLQKQSSYKSVIKPNWYQPTFLIGFPRSGTTLLDTILRTHSHIDVLEELPMLNKMNANFGDFPTVSEIEAMDNTAAEIASEVYFDELRKHIEISPKKKIVDKLPLNILHLPLINQVFPNAKYIIALRHPFDCVLSCWIQDFKLNPAMANMIELERIVAFYDITMSILSLCEERYSLETHRIRYEDLILGFEENVSNLLTFLDLKWEEALRSYQNTALARGKINTPSFSQVIKPLYQTASYRWKHYEEYLVQYKTQLAPWIQEYGY